ncbi:hypothetical protein BDZ94DRAFT_1261590 [Collybia nuda]|uniref:Uncharacterized protein n=1 Tax=Collybia nuda TaxID=64659 RepID=A0A9P5Y2X7_9AGAR|nr:hypothetical protein BDZ94DRAFT_1261590 [Collybia nuda]
METLETVLLTSTAEIFIALRVYAITKKNLIFPCIAGSMLACQWAIAIYVMSLSSLGTDQPALLLSRDLPPLPTLPDIDPYHVCIFISTLTAVPFVEAFLSISLAFDGIAFLIIIGATVKSSSSYKFMPMMRIIRRDGIMYFFVLFSSNLVWIILLLHARPGLKFVHNQPAMMYVFIFFLEDRC